VIFTPTVTGTRAGSVTLNDNAPSASQVITTTGIGTSVQLAPSNLAFATQKVGTKSSPKNVTLTNTGTSALSITSITIVGLNPTDFTQTNTCGTSVGAGKTCTISVTFGPTATGARAATVSVADSGGGSPQSVPLTGTGN
jgi:hypothetical protein